MRLTEKEITIIVAAARKHFGPTVRVYLFGSRNDDRKKGGDIDLFIQNREPEKLTIRNKISYLTDLILALGEQKIDVVLDHPASVKSIFRQTIQQTAIPLC